MADGDYERRGGREAELKRFARILAEAKEKTSPPPRVNGRNTQAAVGGGCPIANDH